MTIMLDTPDFIIGLAAPLPCASQPQLFHPNIDSEGDSDTLKQSDDDVRLARAICSRCPVLLACRAWGRERGETGIWGGETEEERAALGYGRRLQAGERRPECGTEAGAKWHRRYGSGKPCAACARAENEAWLRRRREYERQMQEQWPPHLFPKEQAVLEGLAEGLDRKQIAERLGLARKSIDAHLYKLRKKLRTDTGGLVAAGRELGFLEQPTTELAAA
ncbi:WhiB family transcriptional regulator [Streptomyces sp. bgisy154]|uniref:WhiB family transcriptional regulator n=1 Tax=Streptomyces sp. bgisy154 TaxID=3413794 RepID=UPI003D720C7D